MIKECIRSHQFAYDAINSRLIRFKIFIRIHTYQDETYLRQFLACVGCHFFRLVRLGDVTQHLVHCCSRKGALDALFSLFGAHSLPSVTGSDVPPILIGLLAQTLITWRFWRRRRRRRRQYECLNH